MSIVELKEFEIDNVAGGPLFIPLAIGAFKAAKIGVTLKAAAFGIGGAAAIAALGDDDDQE